MSHSHPSGLLAAYNSLTDKHLTGYFNNTRIRRHLLRSGLITRSGRILSEKEYRVNIMKRDHQKYIRECLAQAIFHKVLDIERYHQLEIRKTLETLARKEQIQRFKGEPTRWSIEKNMPVLYPHPPVGPKTNRGHSVLVDEGRSSPITLAAPRPFTAPGIMQPPIRLQPLLSNPAVGIVPKTTPGSRSKTSPLENETPFPTGGKKARKFRKSMDNSQEMNQYRLVNVNGYMTPIPPSPPPPNGKITRENRSETWRRRRFRPTTAPNGLEPVFTKDSRRTNKTPLHSNAVITMIYLGKSVHLSSDYPDFRDEIKIYQQHCGGENLCIYKGKLLEKETFQFISKRHHGFPFSLTFFLNGMQVNRLSTCCEYKHRKGSRLGGKRGYFGFVSVERSAPCYKCIIAMGLDKKTSPKSKKQKSLEKREELKGEGKLRKDRAYIKPRKNEMEGSKTSSSVFFSADEEKTEVEEVRTAVEEMERKGKEHAWEDDQENIFKYEYEEDFEVDEEPQDEKANKEGQANDLMNEVSKSPSDDEKDNLDPEKESKTLSQKAPEADDSVKDEGDGCSESELEEDKQDTKTASSSSSRSHPYSSFSEDESELGDGEAHTENSANGSVRSSSQELSENDEPGKSHLPTENSLKTEVKKIIRADVEIKSLPVGESLENVLEEETKKGTHVIAEGSSEKSWEHVSKEEKENYGNELWKGNTAKGKDKKAGLCRVEKGVGQRLGGAVEPGRHDPYDAESGVNSANEGEKLLTKPEFDTGAAPNRNLVVEESTALNSNKESKAVASEMYTPEKEGAVEEDEVPQHRDADTIEEKGGVTLGGKAGIDEVPLGEWNPPAEQPVSVELSTKEREIPQGIASVAKAGAEGDRELDEEGVSPMGKETARASGSLDGEEAPEEQALMQTMLETEKAASEEEQSSEKAVFASKAAALNLECVQEVAALKEALMLEKGEDERGAAVSEAGPEKPEVEDSEEEASTDLVNKAPEDDTASEREGGSEVAVSGGEGPAKERKAVTRTETPLNSSTSEKAEATQMRVSEESLEELCKKDEKRTEVEMEVESNKEDDRKETLPEESDAAGERRKAERPKTPLGETESEREEVTRAIALQDEDILEEVQKFKGEEGKIVKEVRPEEEMQVPPDVMECDAENAVPLEGPEWTGDTGPQGDGSLREREGTMPEAAPAFEKSPEHIRAARKGGGGERLREAGDIGHQGRAELLSRENGEKAAPSEQGEGPGPEGEAVSGAPESDSAGQAEEHVAEERSAEHQEGLAVLERRGKEASLQGRQAVGAAAMAQEDISGGESMMTEKLNEDPEAVVDREGSVGTGVVKNGHTEGGGSLQGREAVAEEDLQGGAAGKDKREVLANLTTTEGKTETNTASSFSDVADEETWHKMDGLLRKTAAAGKVVAEQIALSVEEVPAEEEAGRTGASEAEGGALGGPHDLSEKAPQLGPDQTGEEADTSPRAESVGEEGGMGSRGGGQESGAAEDVRLRLTRQTEAEPNRKSLQDVEILPVKADCPGAQEKQEHTVRRASENTDVSLNSKRA